MHLRVVEVVAVHAPGLVEDLGPLGARVDPYGDRVELQLAVASGLRVLRVGFLAGGGHDRPRVLVLEEDPLAVEGDVVRVGLGDDDFGLAVLEVEALDGRLAVGRALEEELAGGAGLKVRDLGGVDGEVDDAVVEAVEVDDDGLRLLRGHAAVALAVRPCGRAAALRRIFFLFFFLFFSLPVLRRGHALLLVALFRERRGGPLLQRRDVDRVRRPRICVQEREPVALRAGVRRGEEVEELPAPVEDGVRDVREAVRQRVGPVLVDGVDVRGPDVRRAGERVRDPARVRRPRAVEHPVAHGRVEALGRDPPRGTAREVDDPEREGVVREDELPAVGREDEVAVEAGAGNLEPPRRAPSILRADDDPVLAALVRDVGDLLAVRRPRGRRLVDGDRFREVPGIALLGGHGHDLAAELERSARAGRRDRRAADPLRALRPARAGLEEVAGHGDREVGRLLRGGVVEVERPRLLEDDASVGRRGVQDGEVRITGQGCKRERSLRRVSRIGRPRRGVQVEFAVAIGSEIHGVAEPHRVGVVAAPVRLRDLLDRVRRDVVEPDPRDEAAAVVLPLEERGVVRVVGDRLPVRRIRGARGVRNRELRLEAAVHGHGVEPHVAVVDGGARRREEDGFPVRRESLHDVPARVPREALRHAARGGDDVDVEVAVQLGAEREERAVGAEGGAHLDAGARRDAFDAVPVEAARPDVVPVHERDALFRERRVRQHHRRAGGGGRGERGGLRQGE